MKQSGSEPLTGEDAHVFENVQSAGTGERIADEEYRKKAEQDMADIINKNRKSKEEKIISFFLTISIFVITIAGCIAGHFFVAPQARAAIIIMTIVSFFCLVAVWIATAISLRKK